MNKVIGILSIVILLIVAFLIGYSIKETDLSDFKTIPSSVLEKYNELEPQFKNSLGTSIRLCIKNNEKIYTVSGNGGFTGVTFYYTEDGDEIGSYSHGDAIDFNSPPPPEPPINLLEYECTLVKAS